MRESRCFWGLASRGPGADPGLPGPRRCRETRPPPCSSVCRPGWPLCADGLLPGSPGPGLFLSRSGRLGKRPASSRAERRGSRSTAHRPGPGTGSLWGDCPRAFPGRPCHPESCPTLEGDGGRRPAAPRSGFCAFRGWRLGAPPRLPQGLVAEALLSPWASRPRTGLPSSRLLAQTGARAPAHVVLPCLLSSQASGAGPREWVTLVPTPRPTRAQTAGSPAWPHLPQRNANGSAALPGWRAALSPDMLLGTEGTGVSLF